MVTEKECKMCNTVKDISNFREMSKAPDGYTYWCTDCYRIYRRQRYQANKKEFLEDDKIKRAARVKWIQSLKDQPCIDCGNKYEPYCMDYDHILERGPKFKNVSRMVLENCSEKSILEEIKKCDLICVLCHNERTHKRTIEKWGEEFKCNWTTQRNIKIIEEFKAKPCAVCNNQFPAYNMQCDHINPEEKLYNICNLKNFKVETLMTELAKCQVLCALCHRRKSILEQQEKYAEYWKNDNISI